MNFSGLFFEGLPSGRGRASVGLGRFTQLARFARLGIMAGVVGAMVGTTGCGSSAATAVDTNQPGMGTLTTATTLALTGSVTATTPQAATLTNSSSATVKILGISISGTNASNFSQTNTCGTQVLAANACTVTVSFTATAPGSYSATLTISTDSTTNGTVTVALTGVATLTQLTQSASSLSFPLMVAGSGSTPQILTLTNSGTVPVTLGSIAISGAYASAFSDTTTCGASLAVSATCTVTVSFASTTTATDTATLSIANSASTGGSATVALTGSAAVPTVSLSASSLSFPLMTAGSASTPQTVTLSNTGTVPVTLGSIAIGGTNASAFSITTKTCGTTLAIAGSCTVTLSYSDAAAASDVATLLIVNNTASNPVTVALSGSTSAPVLNLSSVSLSFPLMVAGSASTPQVVTLTNNGTVPVTLGSIAIGGSNPSAFSITTNTCGSSLAVSGNCAVTINFASATTATDTATLTIANSASTGGSATVALTGSAAVPTISQSATSLTFPLMVSGSGSTPQIVTLTNNGTVSTTLGAITLGGANASAFSKTTTCGTSLAVSATCTVTLSYTEAATASDSATLSIANNSASPLVTVALAGSAAVPTVSLSANSLSFPLMAAGSASTPQIVTLTNNGSVPTTLGAITLSGSNASAFSKTTTCGSTLAVSATCTVTLSYTEAATASDSATLSIANNTTSNPVTVALAGSAAVPTVSLSATTLTFPLMTAGSTSTPQIVTLTNNGSVPTTLGAITLSGSNASAFSKTTTCGTTLAASATCTVTLSYSEAATASDSATLSIANNTASNPVTVTLTGSAAVPTVSLSASSLTLPAMEVNGLSTTASVTLTNNGTVPLTISGFSFTGTNASVFSETTTCPMSLAVSANCSVTITFTPTASGSDTATLLIADNTSTGSTTVAVSGTATAAVISLSSSTLTFTTPAESTSAVQTLVVYNTGTGPLNIATDALSGTNAASFNVTADTCSGTTVPAGSSCTLKVSLTAYLAMSYSGSIAISSNAASGPNTITLTGTGTGTISLSNATTTSTNWIIDNGAITLYFDPGQFHIWKAYLDGDSANNLVDTTYTSSKDGDPMGFYMGNQGLGAGTLYTGSKTGPGYLDVWAGETSSSTNFLTYEMHIVVTANDPGYHTYYVVNHSATDIAGSLSLVLWQFRTNLGLFTHSYTVDSGLNNLGPMDITLPSVADSGSADAARQAQNAVVELSGFTDAPTTTFMTQTGRNFYTKYDYSTYEYLHKGQGTYGPTYGAWVVLPRADTIAGGPTKQNVNTLTDLIQQEMVGAHYDGHGGAYSPNGLAYTLAADVVANKIYGPIYVHFNKMNGTNTATGTTITTPALMYQDSMSWMPWFDSLYDNDSTLTTGTTYIPGSYVPSTARGTVSISMSGIPTGLATHTAWAVLSDPGANMQYSVTGYQYWADISANGTATITGVVPGTYRLTVYVLGQWGEFRYDGVVVTANNTTTATGTWVPENFGSTVFTLGTPDRSAHEFLHGEDSNGNDHRNYYGQFNYWADFAANNGAAVYYATATTTAGVTTPATNDLSKWNYIHWGSSGFDPGIDGNYWCGVTTDDTTDGYTCAIPTYVKTLTGETGTNGVTTGVPAWQLHFATPANLSSYSSGYVDLSVSVACAYGSYVVTLNGSQQRDWHYDNYSDCMIRSGLSGYTQWFVMQWPTSLLNQTVGGDNVLSIGMSATGSSDDAIRLELSNTGANPVTTGWNDYTYMIGVNYPGSGTANSSGLYNNDAVNNP
jgi:hypothetical protein